MGQLHFDTAMREFKYLASNTSLRDLPFAWKIFWFSNVIHFDCCSMLTGDVISYFSRKSSSPMTLSSGCIIVSLARCFLKTASGLNRRCNDECMEGVMMKVLKLHKHWGLLILFLRVVQTLFGFLECWKLNIVRNCCSSIL